MQLTTTFNKQELLNECKGLYRKKEYKKIIEILSKDLKIINNNPSLLHLLADSYHEISNYENAILFYKNVLEIEPSRYWSLFNLARVYSKCVIKNISLKGKFASLNKESLIDKATNIYLQLACLYPEKDNSLVQLSELYTHLNKIESAILTNNLIVLRREYCKNNPSCQPKINFMLIGSMKSATTSLFEAISSHPNFLKPIIKEIHYYSVNYQKGKDWYLSNFIFQGQDYFTGEASTSYFDFTQVPNRIKEDNLCEKFLIILRNPSDRMVSNYYHMFERNQIDHKITLEQSINNQIDKLEEFQPYLLELALGEKESAMDDFFFKNYSKFFLIRSLYPIFLKKWETIFNRKQFHIATFDDFTKTPEIVLSKIFNFLEVDSYIPENIQSYKLNVGQKKKQHMSEVTSERLNEFFSPFNEILRQEYNVSFL